MLPRHLLRRLPIIGLAAGIAVALMVAVTGCAGAASETPRTTMPTGVGVDYQLGGAYDPPAGVGIVVRDSTADPVSGAWSICYVNGFQTQPGEIDRWGGRDSDLLLHDPAGAPLMDPGWPDEALLDTSTPDRRERIAEVLAEDIDRCASSGFDALEIDNLDSSTRSRGALDAEDAVALARLLAERVHALGLAIGQKNAADEVDRMRDGVGFDFAVAEECVEYGECAAYTAGYGDAVIDIEYLDDVPVPEREAAVKAICADPSRPDALVIRDRDLRAEGEGDYFRATC
ncbi:MAG: endo alpha-1,4 polygalactosaminidase [Naasia sp.]